MNKVKFVKLLTLIFVIFVTNTFSAEIGNVSVKNDLYELYAPNKKELKTAKEELDFAANKFKQYFAENPPKIAVYIVDKPADVSKIDIKSFSKRGLQVLPFISNNYLKSLNKTDDKSFGLAESRALSHEAGHKYFITYINKKLPNKVKTASISKYGHSAIPDWFDEAFATLCEFPLLQKRRYDFMIKNIDKAIPFEEFFKMEHPFFKKISSQKPMSKEEAEKLLKTLPKNGATIRIIKDSNIINEKDRIFYSQSLVFTDFLIQREGKNIVGKIANGMIEGKNLNKILGNKSNLQTLEKEWKTWLKTKQ